MIVLPTEIVNELEDTTVVGDIDALIAYIESGQALEDWNTRMAALNAEYDIFLKEHSHVWSHIIIQARQAA
jgi:hypothetical protein